MFWPDHLCKWGGQNSVTNKVSSECIVYIDPINQP